MKLSRRLFVALGVIALVGAVVLGIALTPAVQRWAVLRAIAGRPGLKLEVAEISVGFSSLHLRGIQLEQSGLRVHVAQLDADYSWWPVLAARRLQVQRLTADGIFVDASRLARGGPPTAAVGAAAAAPGLLARLELPFALVLEECRVTGRALLPGAAGQPPVEADYKITGGKFAPGSEGSLLLSATVRDPDADADVAALNAQVSLRARQTGQRTFDRVALTAVVDAQGKKLSEQNQLKISAELTRSAGAENYAVSIDTLIRTVAENLLTVRAALPAGRREYAGQWTLKARTAQLAPFVLGKALPEFAANGTGRFVLAPATGAVDLQGDLQIAASRLESIKPAWQPLGAVKLQARFDVAAADGVARLRQLDLSLAGEKPVLELQAVSAAEFNFKERRLQVAGAAAGELLRFKLAGLPLAWVGSFLPALEVSGGMITGAFSVTAAKDELRLHSTERLHVDGLTVVQNGQPLLTKAEIALQADAVWKEEQVQVRLDELTLKTPAGDRLSAQLAVTLPLQPDPALAVTANYTADFQKLLAPWLPFGPLRAAGEADFILAAAKLELRRLNTTVTDASGRILFQATTLRPVSFDRATQRAITGEKGVVDLFKFTLGRIPLEQVPLNQPGAAMGGRVAQGEFVLSAEGEKLRLHATTPLQLAGVSLSQGGRPVLTGLTIELQPTLELSGRTVATAQSGEVSVRNAAGVLLASLTADATQRPEDGQRGTLTFALEVPALASQPLFAGAQGVSAGRASGEIRVAVGAASQVEARLTVNGLVARESEQTLPVANLSFRGVVHEDGKISLQAPLLLDRAGQRSDLNFALELTPAGRGFGLDGKLTGEHVELADALSVLGVFLTAAAPGEAAPAPVAGSKVVPDSVAAWSRFSGRLAVDIKSVTRGMDWAMTGVTGSVLIEPTKVSLQKLEAAVGEKGRLTAKADLLFGGGAQPYRASSDFSLTEFDAGKLFKALEPARPATIEGIFAVVGQVEGKGATLEQLGRQTQGKFALTSRQGVFRGLQRTSSKVSAATKAVELGASVLGSLFGSDKATRVAEKVAGTAYFVDQLAQSIGEFNYDQLSVRLGRGETLNVVLEEISLVSPEIRLGGSGTVTHVAGKPLLEQPLNVALAFSARGKVEQLLGKLRLLDGTRDELGYAKTQTPVTVTGSLAKPDPSAFFTKIATAKFSELLVPEN